MKLVLKHNSNIKLYTDEMEYQKLLTFVQREMNLEIESISMSYVDDEGDQIVIGSDDDLGVMENLTGNKTYVKVTVEGKIQEIKESSQINNSVK